MTTVADNSRAFIADMRVVLEDVAEMLTDKNARYGDSALNPVRIFSRASVREQILVRIDDKVSRLTRGAGSSDDTEDVEADLIGYLVLLRIARLREGRTVSKP